MNIYINKLFTKQIKVPDERLFDKNMNKINHFCQRKNNVFNVFGINNSTNIFKWFVSDNKMKHCN